jgi:hypothetical protein
MRSYFFSRQKKIIAFPIANAIAAEIFFEKILEKKNEQIGLFYMQ